MCDFKGAGSFDKEFPGGYLKLKVSGFEPYLVSDFPGFEVGEGSFLHSLLCEFVGSFGFLLCVLNLIESLLKSWKEGSSEGWVELWFISHNEGEWGFAGDQVYSCIVGEFGHGEEF